MPLIYAVNPSLSHLAWLPFPLLQVYACFAQLGFDSLAGKLPPRDAAVLVFIQQYVKFRQGEVWLDICTEFAATGLTPTQEDG